MATPPGWPRARPPAGPRSSWSWAATAPSTRPPTGWPAPPARWPPARRVDQRVRPHHRPAQRPDRGDRRPARRAGPALDPPGRPRVGERPLLPVPHRRGLRRRRRRAGRAASSGSSATPATRCSSTPASTRGSATTTAAGPASPCTTRRHGGRRRLPDHRASTPTPTPTWATGRSTWRPEATLDRGLASVTLRTMAFAGPCAAIGSALGSGRPARSRWVDYRTDLRRCHHGPTAGPLPGRRRLPRRDGALEFRHEPDVLDLVLPPDPRPPTPPVSRPAGARTSGTLVTMPSTPGRPASGCGPGRRRSRC